jgi:hypothetical protein
MDLPEVLPARHPDLEVAEFETEFVVFDAANRMVHHLEGVQALVFDACDGMTSAESIGGELAAAGLGGRFADAFSELVALGLLEGTTPVEPPPCLGCGNPTSKSRRRFSHR